MKKILLLLVILMLLVVACNNTAPDAEEMEDEVNVEVEYKEGTGGSIEEWCLAGTTQTVSSTGGSASTEIVGIETYKGAEFCKGVQTTNIEGVGAVETTYYFTYEAQEMWVISTIAGQTTELHFVDGELVA